MLRGVSGSELLCHCMSKVHDYGSRVPSHVAPPDFEPPSIQGLRTGQPLRKPVADTFMSNIQQDETGQNDLTRRLGAPNYNAGSVFSVSHSILAVYIQRDEAPQRTQETQSG